MINDDFWFPWYPSLFRKDTRHLTAEQDGIYRRLIDEYMATREPLPSHGQAIANISMISLDIWERNKSSILPFFKEKDGKLYHKKCNLELDRQDKRSRKQSENAKKANLKRQINQIDASGGSATAPIQDRTGQDRTGHTNHSSVVPTIVNKPNGKVFLKSSLKPSGEKNGKKTFASEGSRLAAEYRSRTDKKSVG